MIRARFVYILFSKELLRFLANPPLWILLLLLFLMGLLVSVSDVVLQQDAFNLVCLERPPGAFLDFVDRREPKVSVYTPDQPETKRSLRRKVFLRILSEDFDEKLLSGQKPALEISSSDLAANELNRLADLLVQNAFAFVQAPVPLDVRVSGTAAGSSLDSAVGVGLQGQTPEKFKRLIMALLITVGLNIVLFNLLTVSFVEEKQNRTLLALLLSPARTSEIAVSKFLFFLLPGIALASALTAVYRPDVLSSPVFWVTLLAGGLFYMSMALVLVSYVERQSTASLICLGYLFFLSSMFILAPRFTALYPIKNHLPENFILSILSFLFDGIPFRTYRSFFVSFVTVSVVAPFLAIAVFDLRMSVKPPRLERRPLRWTLLDCGLILVLCFVFQLFISPALTTVIRLLPVAAPNRLAAVLLLYLGVFAVPLAVILPVYTHLRFRRNLLAMGFWGSLPGRDAGKGLVWFALYGAVLFTLIWVVSGLVSVDPSLQGMKSLERINPAFAELLHTARLLFRGSGAAGWIPFFLLMGMVAPILEEAFFRGCLLSALQHRWGSRIALFGSALAFGILHLNPVLFPVYVVFGLLTGRLYQRTGNLLASIVFHSLHNCLALASLALLFRA